MGASNGKAGHDSEEEIPRNRHSKGEGRSYSRRDSRSPSPDRDRYRDERRKRKRYSRSRSPERDRYANLLHNRSFMRVPSITALQLRQPRAVKVTATGAH